MDAPLSPAGHHPRDQGQVGAIIQTRLDQGLADAKVKDHLWCRLGAICFKKVATSDYKSNVKGQRRRIEYDDKLTTVTPDATGIRDSGKIEFMGISLTDIPLSPRPLSMAYRFPDACGRVALQISGIATVPVARNALQRIENLKIGDHLSIDTREGYLMEFSDDEKSLGLKQTETGDDKLHYIGVICNMNLSPITGPSIDVLLCPQRYAAKLKNTEVTINAEFVNVDFLNKAWNAFKAAANKPKAATNIDDLQTLISSTLPEMQKREMMQILEDYTSAGQSDATCPDAENVSFFGKLALLLGTDHGGGLPGLGDVLVQDKSKFDNVIEEIKTNLSNDLFDTENSAILCQSSEETQWIKAWESWAKDAQERGIFSFNSNLNPKLAALKTYATV